MPAAVGSENGAVLPEDNRLDGPPGAMFPSVASLEADFEDGVLRPLKPLRLRPGERVRIIVRRQPDPARWDLDRLAKLGTEEDLELANAGLEYWASR